MSGISPFSPSMDNLFRRAHCCRTASGAPSCILRRVLEIYIYLDMKQTCHVTLLVLMVRTTSNERPTDSPVRRQSCFGGTRPRFPKSSTTSTSLDNAKNSFSAPSTTPGLSHEEDFAAILQISHSHLSPFLATVVPGVPGR
jgi:hypothetical protein